MLKETFQEGMERAKATWGDKSFPKERIGVFWRGLEKTADHIFQGAMDHLIATQRSAPMLKEFNEAIEYVQIQEREQKYNTAYRSPNDASMAAVGVGLLVKAAETTVDETTREFARACVELAKNRAKYTLEQWNQACDMLDQTAARIARNRQCPQCADGGYVFPDGKIMRCDCQCGRARPEIAYGPTRQDGSRHEEHIPVIQRKAM